MQVVGVSALACLLSAAWIRIAVRIPEPAQSHFQGPKALVSHQVADTKEAAQFLVRHGNFKVVIGLSLAANLIFASYVNVALPYMVTRTLGLSNAMQGLPKGYWPAEACLGLSWCPSALAGSICNGYPCCSRAAPWSSFPLQQNCSCIRLHMSSSPW